MFGIGAALTTYKDAALGLLFVVLVAFAGVQTVRLSSAEKKVLAGADSVRALQGLLSIQNAAIATTKAMADAQQEAANKAAKAAQTAQAKAEAHAARIEAKKAPQTCPDAIKFLVDDAAGVQ